MGQGTAQASQNGSAPVYRPCWLPPLDIYSEINKEGIHKSLPGEGLPQPEPESVPAHKHSKYTRWFQVLAAVLVVCILGGGIIVIQILRTPHATVGSSQHGWCQIPVAGLNTGIGAPTLSGIAAPSANDIWMVGSLGGQSTSESSQTLIEHWDGAHLSVLPSPNTGQNGDRLLGVAEVSPDDVWAVGSVIPVSQSPNAFVPSTFLLGQHTLIEHWDGHRWSIVPSPDGASAANAVNELQSVAAISADDIWAVGYSGREQSSNNFPVVINGSEFALAEHWDGHKWSVVHLPASLHAARLNTITAPTGGGLWAYGYSTDESNDLLLLHWNGQQWSSIPGLGTGAYLYSFSVYSGNDIWATGVDTEYIARLPMFIAHWNGANWQKKIIATPSVTSYAQFTQRYTQAQEAPAIIATSFNDAWVVGSDEVRSGGELVPLASIEHWNGINWQKVPLPQKYTGTLSVLTIINGKFWTAGTIYTGLQQIPSQLVETTC